MTWLISREMQRFFFIFFNVSSFHSLLCQLCSFWLFFADDADESLNDHDDGSIKENFREQDIYLPIANVARIMKNAVPQTGKVSSQREETPSALRTALVSSPRLLASTFKEQMVV